jgi:uncharacterized membrane protein YeaQ/YmgE (transglycosylase-associated protein family)
LDKERIITIVIVVGIFGGLVGGPILSLADYYASPEKRFWIFIIPEFIGFGCLILMVICGANQRKKRRNINLRKMTTHSKIKTQEIDSEVGAGPRRDTIGYRTSQPLLLLLSVVM